MKSETGIPSDASRRARPKSHNAAKDREKTDAWDLYLKVLKTTLQTNASTRIETDRALGYLRARNFKKLFEWAGDLKEVQYEDADTHFKAHQFAALIMKYPWPATAELGLKMTPRQQAVDTFMKGEDQCRRTNRRFMRRRNLQRSRFYPLILEMKRWIARTIGQKPDLESVYEHCGHGGGASMGVHGNATNLHRKVGASEYTCTAEAYLLFMRAMWRDPQMVLTLLGASDQIKCLDAEVFEKTIQDRLKIVDCNTIGFVPKNARTERTIALEALCLTYLQRGIDLVLREKLLKKGFDLTNQFLNAELAREGSVSGEYATIDLTNASGTVALRAVTSLLPESWTWLLLRARSAKYSLKTGGTTQSGTYEMFSSMGNAFTFPLETLIFAAAVYAAQKACGDGGKRFLVYGDDIVCTSRSYKLVIALLRFMGFTPNMSKTFGEGPFRESCGSDWYEGQDVRPVELDYVLLGTTERMIFHNATLRSPRTRLFFAEVRELLKDSTPAIERFKRPEPEAGIDFSLGVSAWVETGVFKRDRKYVVYREGFTLLDLYNLNGAFSVPLDEFMADKRAKWSRTEMRWMWKEFTYHAIKDPLDEETDSKMRLSPLHKQFSTIREGISYLAFLNGQTAGESALRYTTRRSVKYNISHTVVGKMNT